MAKRARGMAALALIVLAAGGCGGGGGASQSAAGRGKLTPPQPSDASVSGAAPVAPSPSLRRLRRTLDREFARAGPASGGSVYDLSDESQLFSLRQGISRPPASVEKLYTTFASLDLLGPHARLRTTVLGRGQLGAGGVWHGNLYLQGGGDPTLGDRSFNRTYERGEGPTLGELARQLAADGIRHVTGRVIGDESLFGAERGGPSTRLAPDVGDFGGELSALTFDHGATMGSLSPGAFAARQLTRTMSAMGIHAAAATRTARAPEPARRLAVVSSPSLASLLSLMDVPSDDLFAEMLTEQLGARFGGRGTIAAGATVISHALQDYGLHPRVVDGSGLSRDDRSSPEEIVRLLKAVWRTQVGDVLAASLPVVGVSGTVQSIADGTAAQGRCVAKTGTLDDVTNLAGYCRDAHHRTLAFALFVDGPENSGALQLIGHMVGAIARYR